MASLRPPPSRNEPFSDPHAFAPSHRSAFKRVAQQETLSSLETKSKEGGRFHGLPPLKRFKILEKEKQDQEQEQEQQQQQQQQQQKGSFRISICCLPAKKRVCALKSFSVTEEHDVAAGGFKHKLPDARTNAEFGEEQSTMDFAKFLLGKKRSSGYLKDGDKPVKKRMTEIAPPATLRGIEEEEHLVTSLTERSAVTKEGEDDDGILCDVCRDADADPSDPIVFCDGCNVMVHASCYGHPLSEEIPSGDWFCAQCESRDHENGSNRRCCLCPSQEGVMKRTTDGRWAHLFCALFVPEVYYRRAKEREAIECGRVPSWRWRMRCELCGQSGGACIQCTEEGCSATFHVACGLDEQLAIEYRHAHSVSRTPAIVIAFCRIHTPHWLTERRRCKIVPRTA